ncbi:hypothetical protein QFC21_005252 [Naganishia friedmannii]|uniref:Uncharacterized protein n=1 Tax=Naganishia friedmannii TaxID=89922 RepID=A0ACC2VAQ6_9TREE|nr:hypothetical protein QFC21_005252 [Naganishia friedmannii]
MSPPTDAQIKRIVGTLNERGQFRSLVSMATTPTRPQYERMLQDLYHMLHITKPADQKRVEQFYSVRRSKMNVSHNRYREIFAFDRTAVRIPNDVRKWISTATEHAGKKSGNGATIGDVEELREDDSGYLNANVIVDGKGSWWVACQAPLPVTNHPFLLAILTRSATFKHAHLYGASPGTSPIRDLQAFPPKTAIIVQLTGLTEGDVVKAHQYLPTRVGHSVTYEPSAHLAAGQPSIKLTLDRTTPLPKTSSILSTLTLAPASSEKISIPPMTVHHYLYEGWPDFGVPRGKDVQKLQELIAEVEMKQKEEAAGGCEVWVHCSAGVGRTGTYMALTSLLSKPMYPSSDYSRHPLFDSPIGPLPEPLRNDPIASLVDLLREQRAVMCQSDAQVKLLYELYTEKAQGKQ